MTKREIYTLDEAEADADLVAELDKLPRGQKSPAVRAGLRLYFAGAAQELEALRTLSTNLQSTIARLGQENADMRAMVARLERENAELRAQLDDQEQASTAKDAAQIRADIDALRAELLDAIAAAALNGHTNGEPGQEDAELAARLDAQLDDFFGD